jgi:mannosyl-oligosaccharide alpha-1,2-mannosidase
MYERMPLGLHPEIAKFDQDGNVVKCFGGDLCVSANDAHSILRPETVESLFVLHRVTKDESFRRQGWRMWQNWERYSRVDTGGYASLASVLENPPGRKKGKQESFFLSETLKYLFLLFSDDIVVPLECFVFNTEGHPLPIMHRQKSLRECVEREREREKERVFNSV